MTQKIVLAGPPDMDDPVVFGYLKRVVSQMQIALDNLGTPASGQITVSNVTTPTTFDASAATLAQTASFAGAIYNALKKSGKIT